MYDFGWATFIDILGYMRPAGHGLDTSAQSIGIRHKVWPQLQLSCLENEKENKRVGQQGSLGL